MTSPTRHLWTPLLTLCVVALLAVPVSAIVDDIASGDNDGGWGLPGPAQESLATEAMVDVYGPLGEAVLDADVGMISLLRPEQPETQLVSTDDESEAEVLADSPLNWEATPGGAVQVQGAGELVLDGDLRVDVRAPLGSTYSMAFLLVDEGAGSAEALLDDPAAKFAVTFAMPLGPVHELDVNKLSQLAVVHADALADDDPSTAAPAVSVLHVSYAPDGALHLMMVRAEADGGVEFVLR